MRFQSQIYFRLGIWWKKERVKKYGEAYNSAY